MSETLLRRTLPAAVLSGGMLVTGAACSGEDASTERVSQETSSTPATPTASEAPVTTAPAPAQESTTTVPSEDAAGEYKTNVMQTIQSQNGVELFLDYHSGSGQAGFPEKIVQLSAGQKIVAECVVFDPETVQPSSLGVWYRVAEGQKVDGVDLGGYHFASNTAYNQKDIGGPEQDNVYDPQMALCEDSPEQQRPDLHDPLGEYGK